MKRTNWEQLTPAQQKSALLLARSEAQLGTSAAAKAVKVALDQRGIQRSANGWLKK
jgi:hypothetical protein